MKINYKIESTDPTIWTLYTVALFGLPDFRQRTQVSVDIRVIAHTRSGESRHTFTAVTVDLKKLPKSELEKIYQHAKKLVIEKITKSGKNLRLRRGKFENSLPAHSSSVLEKSDGGISQVTMYTYAFLNTQTKN